MARYRLDAIADLARQMAFSPRDARVAQIAGAEALLHLIDPSKAYPLEFIVFKITGYRPKQVNETLLTGLALQHDLGLLVETVSLTLDLQAVGSAEPVLAIDDVTERFNVTSKTIQRWRRRGLPARRFIFPDGKRRVGFLLSSVERFVASHREQVANAANFSQVEEPERDRILRRARRLAGECGCCVNEITRRIAQKFSRSPLTVLHIVRKHDAENPESAIFPTAPAALEEADRAQVVRLHCKGARVFALARRFARPATAIYRVLLDERIARLKARKVRFIDDALYHQEDAGDVVAQIVSQEALAESASREELRVPRDLPRPLQDLYRVPLLTPARERALFLAFNYHKFRFVAARRRLDPELARNRDLLVMESALADATEVKNRIVAANLRLVVSVARRHLRPALSLMELVSDGNITLMRAVEGFDAHRGNRFSTYATLALMKGFARSAPRMLSRLGGAAEGLIEALPDWRHAEAADRLLDRDQVGQLLSRLDDRERNILRGHFGLDNAGEPQTYEQLARRLKLSKERVRQIERAALAKLRGGAGDGPMAAESLAFGPLGSAAGANQGSN